MQDQQTKGSALSYKQALAAKKASEETFKVPVPSGFEWELRIPDIQGYVMTGRMPQSLVEQFLRAAQANGVTPAQIRDDPNSLMNVPVSAEDTVASLIFMRELVREACVNPRIVVGGSGADEIDSSEIDPNDFRFIVNWCMSHAGVSGISGLTTFRNRQERRATTSGARRKKLRNEAVGAGKD